MIPEMKPEYTAKEKKYKAGKTGVRSPCCRRKTVLARFCPERAGDYWPAVLIFILLCLLGLDLFFIIRLLLR